MQIEQGIPLPEDIKRVSWPSMKMNAGDSVLITDRDQYIKASMAARQAAKRKGLHCAIRNTPEGMRVWFHA